MKKKVSNTFYNLYGKTTLNIIFAITLSIFFSHVEFSPKNYNE